MDGYSTREVVKVFLGSLALGLLVGFLVRMTQEPDRPPGHHRTTTSTSVSSSTIPGWPTLGGRPLPLP